FTKTGGNLNGRADRIMGWFVFWGKMNALERLPGIPSKLSSRPVFAIDFTTGMWSSHGLRKEPEKNN
ncbi:MAG: hypothetical protein V3U02_02990, partial [Calditrichia bacterium]